MSNTPNAGFEGPSRGNTSDWAKDLRRCDAVHRKQNEDASSTGSLYAAHSEPLLPEIKPSPLQPDVHEPLLHPVPEVPSTTQILISFWSELDGMNSSIEDLQAKPIPDGR